MKLEFPLTPEKIREEIQKVISSIREETNWDLQRTLLDVSIEIGDAPKLGYNFGVNIKKNQLVFGDWIDKVEPEITSRKIWEFVIIRESLLLFVEEELLEKEISELTKLFLNFMAMAYQKRLYEGKSFESEFQLLKARFLYLTKEDKKITKQLDEELDSLLTIIVTHGITYKLIYTTYLHFLEDIPVSEIDIEELINDFQRYLSSSPEEITAPIQFKDAVVIVINELVNLGHTTSAVEIAKNLRMNHSTVTRHLTKLVSRYYAYWRREYNWKKMGLHTYLILIAIDKKKDDVREEIGKELESIPYIFELFDGENLSYNYFYAIIHCPHSTADNLTFSLEKKQNDEKIIAFEIKPIQRRLYRTAFVHPQIKPTLSNFEKFLTGKTPIQKFVLWDNKDFDSEVIEFDKSDDSLLGFLSVLLNKSITTKGYFGVWLDKLDDFLIKNEVNPNDTSEGTNLFNKLQKIAIDKQILDFRVSISPSKMHSLEKLVIKIPCKPDSDSTYRLINDLTIFGWIGLLFSYEEIFFVINGLNYNDSVTKLIASFLEERDLEYEIFSAKSKFSRFIPFNDLYNYKNKKWKI